MPSHIRRLLNGGPRSRRMLHLFVLCAISTYVLQGAIFKALNYVTCRFTEGPHLYKEAVQRELIQLQVLFRHGHRSPFSMYPNDPIPESYWIDGLKHLTMLGRVQHYSVGHYLRERYSNFLTHQPQEVHCLSSGASRCLYGAYALLAGMYPPPPNRMIADSLYWQPIPVEYRPESEDKYLQSTNNCPTSDIQKKLTITSPEGAAFVAKYQNLYDFWSNCSGLKITDYDKAGNLHKTLLLQITLVDNAESISVRYNKCSFFEPSDWFPDSTKKVLNLTLPEWAEETWDHLSVQGHISYYFNFRSKITHRLRAGPLIGRMLDKMKMKMRDPDSSKKVYLYSGHGSNIAVFLHSLDLFNMRYPPFTAFIALEVYKEEGQQYSVRMLYTNGSNPEIDIPEPNVLVLPGCTEYCPFEYLEKYTLHLIPGDYEMECGIQTITTNKRRNNIKNVK